jgi:hypothetical protein
LKKIILKAKKTDIIEACFTVELQLIMDLLSRKKTMMTHVWEALQECLSEWGILDG